MNEIGWYTIDVDTYRRLVTIKVRGTFDEAKAAEFHSDYLKSVYPLDTNDYLLILDSQGMDVIDREMLPKLQVSFALYRKSNFKEICFIILNEEIRQQVLKVIRFSGIAEISDVTYILPEELEKKIERHIIR
ncbi:MULTISPECIES: hypothetical protein [unclassified Exiguobacterium]|uniref:hypothetical protein n=1 Tax=unclassified Exiguobacterium TaxID=2644629 RepID=UPI001BE87E48|nr:MULTISPECIES: hypothetical protein [unclassified Exiguobacterium]